MDRWAETDGNINLRDKREDAAKVDRAFERLDVLYMSLSYIHPLTYMVGPEKSI